MANVKPACSICGIPGGQGYATDCPSTPSTPAVVPAWPPWLTPRLWLAGMIAARAVTGGLDYGVRFEPEMLIGSAYLFDHDKVADDAVALADAVLARLAKEERA